MEENKALFKLPFVRFAPFLTAGMLTAYFGGGIISAVMIACAAAVLLYFAVKRRAVSLCAAGALCGILLMGGYLHFYCEPILEYSDKTVIGELIVSEVTEFSGESEELIAQMRLGGRTAKVRLICEERLEEGQRATAVVEFGAHDSQKLLYNLANGILLSGEVEELQTVSIGGGARFNVFKTLRSKLSGAVRENIAGDSGDLAMAMLFGMDERLSPSVSEKLRICGASHYTAVSGAHFSIFAAVILGMISDERRRLKTAISLLFAPAAVMLFGAGASVLRASVMFFIYSLGPLFMRKSETLNTLCVAVTAISLVSPGTVLDAGFAMSVLGIFGAGVVGTRLSKKLCELLPKKIKKLSPIVTAFSVSVSAVVCTSPVSAALFKGVSLSGTLVSVLLMPLMAVAMLFAVFLGITGLSLLSVPIGLSMKLSSAIIGFFGGIRGLWLTLDFFGAWVLAALFALLLTFAAFGSMKTLKLSTSCMAVLALFSMSMSAYTRENRSEIRFVGNYQSGAAVVINKDEAAVLISGGGGGLAESISGCLRESGAVKIACIAAFDVDYSGALAIRELSKTVSIGTVYSNAIAKELLQDLNVEPVPEKSVMSVSGVTIATASVSESEIDADIAVYHGRITSVPQSSAKTAVYFSSSEKQLPANGHNAQRDRDFTVQLSKGDKKITIEKLT